MTAMFEKLESISPYIVAFCCEESAYQAADKAGQLRMSYPANFNIVSVPCTGRISEVNILEALEKGADAVVIIGCPEGSCHHLNGSGRAKKRVEAISSLLKEIGMNGNRVQMFNIAPNMASEFVRIATLVTSQVKQSVPDKAKTEFKGVSK